MNNIAEGWASQSNAEFIRFLTYSRRSTAETQNCAYIALDVSFVSFVELVQLVEERTGGPQFRFRRRYYKSSVNFSTVKPAWRIIARSVPFDTSL